MTIVLIVVIVGVAPTLVAVPLVLVVLVAIGLTLFRATRGRDYSELRQEDPLYRGLDDYRHGRGYQGLDQERSSQRQQD